MRIISYNLNGIRAAMKKGFIEWLQSDPADIICIQETKAQPADVDHSVFEELGYRSHWFSAEKKGYSGVAILSKMEPDQIITGTGHQISDREGRVIRADFGDIS